MLALLLIFDALLLVGAVIGFLPKASYRWRAAVLCGCAALLLWSVAFGLFYLNRGLSAAGQGFIGDPVKVAEDLSQGLQCLASGSLAMPLILIMTAVSLFIRRTGR